MKKPVLTILLLTVLVLITMDLSAQAHLCFPGINQGDPIPITSAELKNRPVSSSGRNSVSAGGSYLLINRNMDSHSSLIQTYGDKGKLIKGASLKYVLSDGTLVEEQLDYAVIQERSQSISAKGHATEVFKLFFVGRHTNP